MVEEKKIPPIVHLSYSKGELIIKEGDYGISIYKILNGHVRIFKKSGNNKIQLATLERGEVFGEMTFFNFLLEPRSASVEAMDDVKLEVWHPARLIEEYKNMPPMLRYITKQALSRLVRMNRIVNDLSSKKGRKKEKDVDPEAAKRKYHRKKWDQEFIYRSVGSSSELKLSGMFKDISLKGLGTEVPASNALHFTHNAGDDFEINIQLPSGKTIDVVAQIRSVKKSKRAGYLLLGLEFKDISRDANKQIGFFMMA